MGMLVKKVTDPAFRAYGKIISGYDLKELLEAMENTPLPEDVVYVPSEKALEDTEAAKALAAGVYGGMPVQVGFCNGHNRKLNAVEYHRDSEVNVAAEDLVLILGKQQDISDDYTYDTSKMEAFLLPAGTAVEVYATTLHYAPCHVNDKGFRCVVVLPRDTNTEIDAPEIRCREDQLLFARNKWLIGHKEGGLPENAYIGLKGENLTID